MFKTKRIKALEDTIKYFLTELRGIKLYVEQLRGDFYNTLVSCSTCKCLIRKEDAVKGKSEIVRNDIMTSESCGDKKYGTFIEELVTPYYCHNKDCKPKK